MKIVWLVCVFLFLGGCTAQMQKSPSLRWDQAHLQEMASEIADGFISSGIMRQKRYRYFSFDKIRNDTYDHINTYLLKEMIIRRLAEQGVHFVKIDTDTKNRPDAIFHGKISAFYQKDDRSKEMYYFFRLYLTDIQSAKEVWSRSGKIRSKRIRETIGW